jgi:hypothetical protein
MKKTLLSRVDIEKIGGVSRTKTQRIIDDKKYKFPEPEKSSAHNKLLYDAQKVRDWFKANDMKKIRIRFSAESIDYRSSLDIELAQQFLFGRLAAR